MKKKMHAIIACCWVCEIVEMKRPAPRVVKRNGTAHPNSTRALPRKGMRKTNSAAAVTSATWKSPITAKGRILPNINSIGMTRTEAKDYMPASTR